MMNKSILMKMVYFYIIILLAFTNSYQYTIIDLEPYRYIHYADD